MSGYIGNPDAESEHALILPDNAIHAARQAMQGSVRDFCLDEDCLAPIPEARKEAARKNGMKCWYCIACQPKHDSAGPRVKMLDRIL